MRGGSFRQQFDSLVIGIQCFLLFAQTIVNRADCGIGLPEFRVDGNCLEQGFFGAFKVARPLFQHSDIAPDIGIVRLKPRHLVKLFERLFRLFLFGQRNAQHHLHNRHARIFLGRLARRGFGLREGTGFHHLFQLQDIGRHRCRLFGRFQVHQSLDVLKVSHWPIWPLS